MKKYFGIICMMFILSFPFKAKAECDNATISKFYRLASNVLYNYTYEEHDGEISFDVVFTNLKDDITLYDELNDKFYVSNDEVTVKNLKPNTSYKFELYSYLNVCTDQSLRVLYVKTPSYNKYYKDDICKGLSNYKYCKKWINVNISYNEFKNNVAKYRESLKKNNDENVENKNIIKKFMDFISLIYIKYYYIILSLIIIISIITLVKKNNESKLK